MGSSMWISMSDANCRFFGGDFEPGFCFSVCLINTGPLSFSCFVHFFSAITGFEETRVLCILRVKDARL